jgi:hypothetical protein
LFDQSLSNLRLHGLKLLIGERAVLAAIPKPECLAALIIWELTTFKPINQLDTFEKGLPRFPNGLHQVSSGQCLWHKHGEISFHRWER